MISIKLKNKVLKWRPLILVRNVAIMAAIYLAIHAYIIACLEAMEKGVFY